MAIAEGTSKVLTFGKETTFGTAAAANAGQNLRRVQGSFSLIKETYQSEEIRSDYQIVDFRHGVRSVEGSISGELSPGSYSSFIAAALARDFTVGATTGAVTVVGINGTTKKFTRATGSFLTAGFKIGDVVRATGFATTSLNGRNYLLVNVTATEMDFVVLDGNPVATEAAGATVTVAVYGKKTYAPLSGHTDPSFTFEEWFPSNTISEVYVGNKVDSIGFQLPASGLTTVDIAFKGRDLDQSGGSQYFTSPAAASTSGIFAAVNGALLLNGQSVGLVTGLNFTINRNMTMNPVVGSNLVPDIFEGRIVVDGELTVYFESGVYRDYFDNEDEVSLVVALVTSNQPDADFMSFSFPRIKLGSATKDDGETGIQQTLSFQALRALTGGTGIANEATTMQVNDSLAA